MPDPGDTQRLGLSGNNGQQFADVTRPSRLSNGRTRQLPRLSIMNRFRVGRVYRRLPSGGLGVTRGRGIELDWFGYTDTCNFIWPRGCAHDYCGTRSKLVRRSEGVATLTGRNGRLVGDDRDRKGGEQRWDFYLFLRILLRNHRKLGNERSVWKLCCKRELPFMNTI